MATIARYHKQRRVTRGPWKARFTKQRINYRGTTKGAAIPTLASISPTTAVKNTGPKTITLTGTGFISGLTRATVNGGDVATTYVSATSVTCVVPNTMMLSATTLVIGVHNGDQIATATKNFVVTDTLVQVEEIDPNNPGASTIAVVEAWVDANPDMADEVLAAEEARGDAARSTLVSWLQGFISDRDAGHIP